LAALLVLPAAPAWAGGFTVKPLSWDVVVGPQDDTRCRVAGALFTPHGASPAAPVPAIMATNGFGGSYHDQAEMAREFASRGYAFLTYSGLGFGGSGCKITIDDRDFDGKAASQLITFLGGGKAATDGTRVDFVRRDARGSDGRPYEHDPRIGMVGGSYGGQVQFAAAGIDPRLDTIVPLITWNDLSYSLQPNNTAFARGVTGQVPGVNKFAWSTLFFAVGVGRGLQFADEDPARLAPCPNFDSRICPGKIVLDATGAPNAATTAALRHASVASFIDRIRIPTFLIQGQADTLFNLQEAVATYRSLKAQGTPVKLAFSRFGHSGSAAKGELDLRFQKESHLGRQVLEWFEHQLKGDPRAPSLDVTFFRDWVAYDGVATPAYGRAPAYPVGRALGLRLSGDGSLRREDEPVQDGSATFATTAVGAPTSYTELSALDPGATPVDTPGTSTAFSTPPLAEDLDVVGVPAARLRIQAPVHAVTGLATDVSGLVFFLRLEDVAPDGTVVLKHKLVSPVRVADPSVPVDVELPGIVHRFAKGHRLRLVAYGGDLSYRAGNVPGPVSIVTSGDRPSMLELPVAVEGRDYGAVVGATAPTGTCAKPRRVVLQVARRFRARLRSARVVVGGETVARLSRKRSRARVSLTGRPGRRVAVRIVMRLRDGRTVTDVRRLRVCR
ncbi:MAG TPA: CocE/NonD family hydrolase, partial [Baekduia sp.]|nr:CocE/NonD family hydrolase [Baekduia sp.]